MRPRLVLFGDTITELSFAAGGWGAALADHFARKLGADVVLRGGRSGWWRGPWRAPPPTPTRRPSSPCSSLDEYIYQANLRAICGYLKVASESDSVSRRYMEKMTLQNYRNVPAGTNAQACLAVAKELNYPTSGQRCSNFLTDKLLHYGMDLFQVAFDGLHFTPFGNKILLDCVLETLESIGFSLIFLCSMISTPRTL
uniref:SGNH hydrolase-type esterase domain-containing protein n=1 Tax=Oryza rufipogon TaxID=4529 RepID=A0A0E0MXR2_ORYRU